MKHFLKNPVVVATIFTSLILVVSCKKTNDFKTEKNEHLDKTYFAVTPDEKKTVAEIMKVTEIIKKVYAASPDAVKEVNGLIKAGYYKDEFILLKDVLKPESSALYLSPKTNTVEHKGQFKQAFLNAIGAGNILARSTEDFLNDYLDNKITIYFPYSDMFTDPDPKSFTVVPADRDGDEAPGFILRNDNTWSEVAASDEYSVTNPCHLIGVTSDDITPASDEIERVEDPLLASEAARCGFTFAGTPEDRLPEPPVYQGNLTKKIKVLIGNSRCVYQFDTWISIAGNGGGSEIMYSRGDGYLKFVDDHVTDFQDVTSVQHTRSDIRNKRALYVKAVWDFGWEDNNTEQYFAIWEEDNKGSINFKFSLGTTVTISTGNTGTGSIGFEITKKSQDRIIHQYGISRNDEYLPAARDGIRNAHGYMVGFDITRIGWCNYRLTSKYDYTFLNTSQCPWPKYNWADASYVGWTWPYVEL